MNPDLSIFIAFGGGLLSFFSPCILPLIPSYLTLLIGDFAAEKGKKNIIIPAVSFILGFSIVFILMGLSASFLGKILLSNMVLLRKIGGIIVIILGLHLANIIKISSLYQQKGGQINKNVNSHLRAPIMGISMAFAWTPCVGPILSSILIYAGTSSTIWQGGLLLSFYSLGLAVPFLLTALFFNWFLPGFKKINPYLNTVQKVTGILLIILGILIYIGYIALFSNL